MIRTKIPVVVVLSVIALAAAFFVLSGMHARILGSYWQGQLAAAPDDRVDVVIRQISALGKSGVPILAEALDCDRDSVAQAAKEELSVQIKHWRMLSMDECVSHFTALAEALAERVDHFRPEARIDAMDLTARILRQPLPGGQLDTNKLLAASEKVLRIGLKTKDGSIRRRSAEIIDPALLKRDDFITDSRPPPSELAESSEQPIAERTNPPGEGSSDKSVSPSARPDDDETQTADSGANRPRVLDQREASRLLESVDQPPRASKIPDRVETRGAAPIDQSTAANKVRPLSHIESGVIDNRPSPSLASANVDDLMRKLNAEDDADAAAAEAELRRRGLTAVQLETARRMFDPDPAVRKRLVQQLPGLQGVDAVPWLMRLARDTEAEVRLAAIGFLATSANPAVLDEVEQIALRDADSTVRQIADRIGRQRNARR